MRLPTDLALARAAAAGDEEAFTQLVRRHQRRVFNLARALTGSDDEAEDLAQETFIRAFRGLARFRGDSAFSTWLYRIAVNAFRSWRSRHSMWATLGRVRQVGRGRRVGHVGHAGRAGAGESEMAAVADTSPELDIESALVRRDVIDKALARIPPDLRLAVTLHDVEGLEYREIAEVLAVPIGTVMSRIFRGRRRLRTVLAALMK